MKLSLVDRSNYYRGMLVLSRRDRIVDAHERELMIRIGMMLDFEKRFCEASIDDLLNNPHLTREPVTFSDPKIAECFFHDAMQVALVDGDLNPMELRWLRRVAHANGFKDKWIEALFRKVQGKNVSRDKSVPLLIQKYL